MSGVDVDNRRLRCTASKVGESLEVLVTFLVRALRERAGSGDERKAKAYLGGSVSGVYELSGRRLEKTVDDIDVLLGEQQQSTCCGVVSGVDDTTSARTFTHRKHRVPRYARR